jgi:DNA polymerase-3 subunit alpha (Gram-positive type)
MLRRGISFLPISLYHSDATNFIVEENGKLRPPLASVPGMSEKTAIPIVEEREKGDFLSVEDLKLRAGVNSAVTEELRLCGALDGLPTSTQIDLFSLLDQP